MNSNDNRISERLFNSWLTALETTPGTPAAERAKHHLRSVFEKYAALREENEILLTQSTKDPMTGAANYTGFSEAVEREISRIKHNNSESFVLVSIDLDGLKRVNDNIGHDAGDALIIDFAELLSTKLRASDTLCHKSGDEFWVLATDTTIHQFRPHFDAVMSEINGTRIEFDPADGSGPTTLKVEASYGYGEYSAHNNTQASVMRVADKNMYENKHSRKEGRKHLPGPSLDVA